MEKENLLKYYHTYTKINDLYSLFDDAAPNELLRINDDLHKNSKNSCKHDVDNLFKDIFPKILKQLNKDNKINESIFVDESRVNELLLINSNDFDLIKIVRICKELNLACENNSYLSIAMLSRALIDHVPPIFGCKNFQGVSNNYNGSRSFKKHMEQLNNSLRKIGDQYLHTHIRRKEVLPTFVQVNFSSDIDVLLSEIVRLLKN
jgi:hypothetical protein